MSTTVTSPSSLAVSVEPQQISPRSSRVDLNHEILRLGRMDIPHCVLVASDAALEETKKGLTFSNGNLCETLKLFKNFPGVWVYIDVPSSVSSDGVPLTTKERIRHVSNVMKRAAILGGDRIAQGGLGRQNKNSANRVLCLRCQCFLRKYGKNPSCSDILRERQANNNSRKDTTTSAKATQQEPQNQPSPTSQNGQNNKAFLCPFGINVFYDELVFFVKTGLGSPYHSGHPVRPNLRMPKELLSI